MRDNKPSVKIEMDVKDLNAIVERLRSSCPAEAKALDRRIQQAQNDADIKKFIKNGVLK